MNSGVKVLINTRYKDNNEHVITEHGYIVRQIDANLYEVFGESSQITYFLNTSEFIEI